MTYVHVVAWLRKNGVDPKAVQLELPLPQLAEAFLNNQIDAGWVVEPFLTVMMQSGKARALVYAFHANVPGMDITACGGPEHASA